MYMKTSCKFHRIPGTQSHVITKVHDLLGQPLYVAPYRMSWIIFTLDLVVSCTDNCLYFDGHNLCYFCSRFVSILLRKIFHDVFFDDNEAFNSMSRYLVDLLNIDNPYFDGQPNLST